MESRPAARAIEEANRLQRVDELFNVLKEQASSLNQSGKTFPGVCVLRSIAVCPLWS
jgi:hypothetical protein